MRSELFRNGINDVFMTRLLEAIDQSVIAVDLQWNIVYWNRFSENLYGWSADEVLGSPILEFIPSQSAKRQTTKILECVGRGDSWSGDLLVKGMDGTVFTAHVSYSPILNEANEMVGIIGFSYDITDRKRQDGERKLAVKMLHLLNSSNDTRQLMRMALALLHEWSGCTAVGIRMRQDEDFPYYETSGFPLEFVQLENRLCAQDEKGETIRNSDGSPLLECMCGNIIRGRFDPSKPFFTENGSFWSNCTTELLASTTEADRQARTRNRCNGEGYESVALIPLRTATETFGLLQLNDLRKNRFSEKRIALLESLANSLAVALSEREANRKLKESEKQYRMLVENLNDLVVKCDDKMRLIFVSPNYCQVFDVKESEFLGNTFAPMMHKNDFSSAETSYDSLYKPPHKTYHEERALTVDGWRWFGWSANALLDDDGNIKEVVSVGRDITERKQAEKEIKASLKEKEVLLKEVHHRVKNNLQVISSLLSLQAFQLKDQKVRQALEASKNRIYSIARVHERLYAETDFSRIDFMDYIKHLVHELTHSLGADKRVAFDIQGEEPFISIDRAVPCGLILNELVTNAIKYAFPGDRKGRIRISFQHDYEEGYQFVVHDDGIGMPEGIDVERTESIGLYLVNVLTIQLQGTLKMENKDGTRFEIRFPG